MRFWLTEIRSEQLAADPFVWLYGAFHLYSDCNALNKRGTFGKPVEVEADVEFTEDKAWESYVSLNGRHIGYVCFHCFRRREYEAATKKRNRAC